MKFVLMFAVAIIGCHSPLAFAQKVSAGGGASTSRVFGSANYQQASQNLNQQKQVDTTRNGQFGFSYGSNTGANVRFSTFNQVQDDRKNTIREDAAVMNHLISKKLPLKNRQSALGVSYLQFYGTNGITYNDQGLTFAYHVPVVLIPGEDANANVSDDNPKSAWDAAKDEIKRPAGYRPLVTGVNSYGGNKQSKFDQAYVDGITSQIRTALSNAGNIRNLNDDDWVTVLVYGASNKPGMQAVKGWRIQWKNAKKEGSEVSAALEESSYEEKSNGRTVNYYYDNTVGASGAANSASQSSR